LPASRSRRLKPPEGNLLDAKGTAVKMQKLGDGTSARDFAYQIGGVFRGDFLQQIGTVEFDGTRADFEKARNLLTGMSHNDFSQDPTLPRR
jgi:hypothetical protein